MTTPTQQDREAFAEAQSTSLHNALVASFDEFVAPNLTTPTQQDREAAAIYASSVGWCVDIDWLSSSGDHVPLVQAFMRHRLDAEQAQRERDARIAEGQVSQHDGTFRGLRKAIAAAIRGDEA